MLRSTVAAIQAAADELAQAERRLRPLDPGAVAFGAGARGLLGDLGREAYQQWQTALDARARAAAEHAQRLREFAGVVERAGDSLADAEAGAAQAQREPDAGLP